MPRATNGTGTTHYGHSGELDDGSYVTTVWVAVFFLPLFPIRSERILPISLSERDVNTSFRYAMLGRVPLDWREVAKTYLVGWSILTWYVLGGFFYQNLSRFFGEEYMFVVALGWLVLPFSLLIIWQKWLQPAPRLKLVRPTFDARHGVYRKVDKKHDIDR